MMEREFVAQKLKAYRIQEFIEGHLGNVGHSHTVMKKTPLGEKTVHLPTNKIVLCSILRAGLPLHNGLLNYFDDSENAFISA